jgi:hypothetical protein
MSDRGWEGLKAFDDSSFHALAHALTEATWCSGTVDLPAQELKLFYAVAQANNPTAAQYVT